MNWTIILKFLDDGVIQKQKLSKVREHCQKNGQGQLRLLIGSMGMLWVCIGKTLWQLGLFENFCL